MKRPDISKILFYLISIAAAITLSFAFGLYSGSQNTIVYKTVNALKSSIEGAVTQVGEEATTLLKIHPKHMLHPARYKGTGVTVNDVISVEEELILLQIFFDNSNHIRLIRRDGTVVSQWPVSFSEIFPDTSHLQNPPDTDWNVDTHGALALPDGSVVFNFENAGLVKLDRCGSIVWTLARQTHHSVERAEGSGFWVPGRRFFPEGTDSPFPPFETPFYEDTIMRISDGGKVLTEISLPRLFYENGLEAILTATGHWFLPQMRWDQEIVHLNKIEELSSAIAKDFPMFEAGDLAVSIRNLNLVMVISPNTHVVKWWRIGPWLRQHDPEFIPGGKIRVFNNNVYENIYINALSNTSDNGNNILALYTSNIMELDISSGEHSIVYGGRKGQGFLSAIRGKHELTPNGGLLITEFSGGRVFETDTMGNVIWEYINRYNADEVAQITEARIYPASYFTVSEWSCDI